MCINNVSTTVFLHKIAQSSFRRNGILGHRHGNYDNGSRGSANDRNIVDSEANELPGSVRNTNTNSDTTGQTPSSGYNFSSRLSQVHFMLFLGLDYDINKVYYGDLLHKYSNLTTF